LKRAARDEAEKPFWISFADLMSALMVLFLIVMSVALLAVTKTVDEAEQKSKARDKDISDLLDQVVQAAKNFPGVSVDKSRNVIDFGDRARFEFNSNQLSITQAELLRAFVPKVLEIARNDLGRRWLKRIVVEGFTDQTGTYLYNLNLSLQRSQRVICVLLGKPELDEAAMSIEDLAQVRELFLVGGYSFNSAKINSEDSRRIELRLEFFGLEEVGGRQRAVNTGNNIGDCALR
jgi:outer membrane protein OmpA-like peptidoglycan-associated protein